MDQETLKIYGHVVASNPLGEAYVVPFEDTLGQIKEAFGAEGVSLPDRNIRPGGAFTPFSEAEKVGQQPI